MFNWLHALQGCPSLERLRLAEFPMRMEFYRFYISVTLTRLEELVVQGCKAEVPLRIFLSLSAPNLKTITIRDIPSYGDMLHDASDVVSPRRFPNLSLIRVEQSFLGCIAHILKLTAVGRKKKRDPPLKVEVDRDTATGANFELANIRQKDKDTIDRLANVTWL